MGTPAGTRKRSAAMTGMEVTTTAVTGIYNWNWQYRAVAADGRMLSAFAGGPPERVETLVGGTRKKKYLNGGDLSEAAPTDPRQGKPAPRSQKLGDKVRALQQLVSPFGKTDTASVLQEATVQITLLHERIRVLSMPYFEYKCFATQGCENCKFDLQSKGLCLVPISSTCCLGNTETRDNGATERTSISPFFH